LVGIIGFLLDNLVSLFLGGKWRFAVVHNGIIENYASLKAKLQQDGVKFKSDTDTEVVAHLVSRFYKGSLKSAVIQAISKLEGAFGIVCADEPDVLIGARRGSPTLMITTLLSPTAAATKS